MWILCAQGWVGQAHINSARPPRQKVFLQKIFGFEFSEPICTTKKSKKPLLFLSRRFAPRDKIPLLLKQVLFWLPYTTKSEPISNKILTQTNELRHARVRASTLAPIAFPFFFDSAGISFWKVWAMGRGRTYTLMYYITLLFRKTIRSIINLWILPRN